MRPPILERITDEPLEPASRAVRPKGSSQVEGTTVIDDFSKYFNVWLWGTQPMSFNLGCEKLYFSLGSSPITGLSNLYAH